MELATLWLFFIMVFASKCHVYHFQARTLRYDVYDASDRQIIIMNALAMILHVSMFRCYVPSNHTVDNNPPKVGLFDYL